MLKMMVTYMMRYLKRDFTRSTRDGWGLLVQWLLDITEKTVKALDEKSTWDLLNVS